ncbi:hypothetical protein WA026_003020 [Henosepilachna vigintioctopunctata]|uniref:Apolipoprotein D n=1 Tax=Henosepilachna vigintioctopunctata TaxID=420089 RepID=A0AAW1TMV7_9CUCU
MNAYLIFAVLLAHGIQAQVLIVGKCPEIKEVQKNFDANKFVGTWYLVESYFAVFEIGKKCIEPVFSLNGNGTLLLRNRLVGKHSQKSTYFEGYSTTTGESGEAKFLFHFTSPPKLTGPTWPYWVLETDYDSYAVVWSCLQTPKVNNQLAWVLTRDRKPSQETLDKAHAVFDKNDLDKKHLFKTEQTNCPK